MCPTSNSRKVTEAGLGPGRGAPRSGCPLVHCTASQGEAEAPSSLKKLTAWEAAQAIAHIPEGDAMAYAHQAFAMGCTSAQPLHKMSNVILKLLVWYYITSILQRIRLWLREVKYLA